MAIKQVPVTATYGYIPGIKLYTIQFTQHFSSRWKPGEVVASESAWYMLSYDNKDQLLTKLKDADALIKQVLDRMLPQVAEKHFAGLVPEAFTIGFSRNTGFTVDAFDKRHLKLIEMHPASGLHPVAKDPAPNL